MEVGRQLASVGVGGRCYKMGGDGRRGHVLQDVEPTIAIRLTWLLHVFIYIICLYVICIIIKL